MSQEGIIDIVGSNPQIPVDFIADVGSAVPIGNTLEILGDVVPAGILPVFTTGSGNTITTNVQITQAIAVSNPLNVGLAAFNSGQFSVDANGFVSLIGGGTAIDSVATNVGGPIFPDGTGQISILGTIAAASGNPLRSNGTVANTVSLVAQVSSAQVGSSINNAGMASFDNTMFTVDANGFVSLIGGSLAIDSIAVQTGTSPVVPTGAGLLTFNGEVVAAGTNPVRTNGTGANTMALQVQIASAIAATDATRIGLAAFDSAKFTVDANGFVSTSGTGVANTITGNSGGALSPTAGNWNIFGAVTAAGTSPVTTSGAGSTLTVNVQTSQALAAADATKIGLSNFDSTSFGVTATGFVTLNGGGFTWNDVSGAFSPLKNNGYFITGTATGTLPASPAQGDTIKFFVDHASQVLTIDAPGTQLIRLGSLVTSAGGTAVSTLQGDSVELVYRASDTCWCAIAGFTGTWIIS